MRSFNLSAEDVNKLRDVIVQIAQKAYAKGFDTGAEAQHASDIGQEVSAEQVISDRANHLCEIIEEVGSELCGV